MTHRQHRTSRSARRALALLAAAGAVTTMIVAPVATAARPQTSVSWSTDPLSFESVPVFGMQNREVILTNTGTRTLRRVDIVVTGGDFFLGGENCSTLVLRMGDSCTVNVIFAPLVVGLSTGKISTTLSKTTFSADLSGWGVDSGAATAGQLAVVSGESHSCSLTPAGGVACWGSNDVGQLGNGTVAASSTPVDVVGLASGVVMLSAGLTHTCALTARGEVRCWGGNLVGQIGDRTFIDRAVPVTVTGLDTTVTRIAAAARTTCALFADGRRTCWGNGYSGRISRGSSWVATVPDLSHS